MPTSSAIPWVYSSGIPAQGKAPCPSSAQVLARRRQQSPETRRRSGTARRPDRTETQLPPRADRAIQKTCAFSHFTKLQSQHAGDQQETARQYTPLSNSSSSGRLPRFNRNRMAVKYAAVGRVKTYFGNQQQIGKCQQDHRNGSFVMLWPPAETSCPFQSAAVRRTPCRVSMADSNSGRNLASVSKPQNRRFYGISADAEREEDVSQSRCRHDQAFCTLAQFFLIHNALSYSGHACAAAVRSLAGNEKSSILGIW